MEPSRWSGPGTRSGDEEDGSTEAAALAVGDDGLRAASTMGLLMNESESLGCRPSADPASLDAKVTLSGLLAFRRCLPREERDRFPRAAGLPVSFPFPPPLPLFASKMPRGLSPPLLLTDVRGK